MKRALNRRALWLAAFALLACAFARAQPAAGSPHLGLVQLQPTEAATIFVFYPTSDAERAVQRGPFHFSWAADGKPLKGNGRLVVISHGSGGSPWVHADLARALVNRGFTVAIPLHQGDNYLDPSESGPVSWRRRPREISQAIDVVARHEQFASQLALDAVGMFGGSAGGHTALTLAGGEWSDARFKAHCDANIEEDFSSCVGFFTLLKGNAFDALKVWAARRFIAWRFGDTSVQQYRDPRITAAVAMVPFAADFNPGSLARPVVHLGLVIARQDVNQVPRFHVEQVAKACLPRCEVIGDLAEGSHGAMLSPMPPLERGSVAERILADPPGFERERAVAELNEHIADFFVRHLRVTAPMRSPALPD